MLTLMAAAAGLALCALYTQARRHRRERARWQLERRLREAMADAGGEWPDHERAGLFRTLPNMGSAHEAGRRKGTGPHEGNIAP